MKSEVVKLLKKVGVKVTENNLETPPDSKLGDLSLPCFLLSKSIKKNPSVISKELEQKISIPKGSIIKEVKSAGPYLNFFFDENKTAEITLKNIMGSKNRYGDKKKLGRTVVIEFPAPNTNKPLHLGHLRNMALGESVSRILETQGYDVVRVNLNNDRGVHICQSVLAYKKWGKGRKPTKKSDHFVGDFYVMFSKKVRDNPKLKEEVQDMLRKWEARDPETMRLWKKMREWAIEGFSKTYERFGIRHEKTYHESEIYEKGREIVLKGLEKGIFQKDKSGNVVVDLGKLGKKVLLREDGTSVYVTQDLYLAKLRYDDYKYDKSIYVVANEQDYHFKVLFTVLRMLGFKFAEGCHHLSYGMIYLPEGRMKSREGTIVDADELMDKLTAMAKKEVESRHKLSKSKVVELSEKINLAALKYFLLKYSAHKNFTFNPKESLSFDGETGPYLQYSAVRAKRILEKSEKSPKFSRIEKGMEYQLIKKFMYLEDVLSKAAENLTPHSLANYAMELAQMFSEFYTKCQVIGSGYEASRLAIVKSYYIVISKCLYLLGIDVPEMM